MNYIKKFGVSFFIALAFLISFPQPVHAQYVDVGNAIKEYVADTIAYQLINLVIKKISAQTVAWINSGFEGKPAFLEDSDQFFLNMADETAGDFFAKTNLDGLCTPFKAQVRLALVKNYISNGNSYACNLSKLKDNYDQFMQDFSKGGWEGWIEVTQNDSNNPFGAYFEAESSLSKIQELKKTKYKTQLDYGRGILSFERCPANGVVTQTDIDNANALIAGGQIQNPETSAYYGKKVGDCIVEKQTVTPGSVINEQLNKVLGGPNERIQAADEVDEILGALLNQLANAVVGGIGKGLRGLTQSSNGEPSTYDELITSPAESISNPNAGGDTGPLVTCVTDPNTGVMTCKAGKGKGGLSACMNIGTGHGNDPGAPTTIDPSNIVYELTNAASWKVAGTLNSVTADDNLITFSHDRLGAWTAFDVSYVPNDPAFSSPWILIWRKNPDPITISATLSDTLKKFMGVPLPINQFLLSSNLYYIRDSADSAITNNWLLVPLGRYFCGNVISSMDTNCFRYRAWKATINNAGGIIDQISVIEQSAPSNVIQRIGPALTNVKTKSTAFVDFMTNTIGNDQDKPLYKQSDYNNLVKKANELIDSINALIPQINDLINPPPLGSGRWHAIPFTYLTVANPNSREVDYVFCGGLNGARTYSDFTPTDGDMYGFMLSTPARDSNIVTNSLNAKQKTNIITYTWPTGIVRPQAVGNLPTTTPPTGGGGYPAPTDALTKHPDQSGTIAQAKADLITQGVNISGACGAWEIVRLAAKMMGGGAGLLNKPGGNNCNGYAVDIIAYPDGYIFDALIDSGNANTPSWNPTGCPGGSTCPAEYRPAP